MEISLIEKNTIKIRGKTASVVVDPSEKMAKTAADAIVFLAQNSRDDSSALRVKQVDGHRIKIVGPGEYEVSSIKIKTVRVGTYLVHTVGIDGLRLLVGSTQALDALEKKGSDLSSLGEHSMVVLHTDSIVNQLPVAELDPRVVIFYGENAHDAAAKIGKNNVQSVRKFTASSEKLPEEMEAVVLG